MDHKKKLKINTFVGNTGHFDNEVDYAGSEGMVGVKVVNIKPHVGPFVFQLQKQFDKKVATLQLPALGAAISEVLV